MLLVSSILDLFGRLAGPRVQFRISQHRMRRWRNVEVEWLILDRLVDPRRAAVDVGGNHGLYAGRLAQLCRSVHCFEPLPALADHLELVLPRRVRVHRIALSDHAGTATLQVPYNASGQELDGLSTLETNNAQFLAQAGRREVPCVLDRLDAVVREPTGFIKIDVEGHEPAVLRGAQGLLERDRPTLLVESQRNTNPACPEAVISFLASLGYAGHFYEKGRLRDIAALDPEFHQGEDALARGTYVNNLIFTGTRTAADRLPSVIA